jgi:hypothetical protein
LTLWFTELTEEKLNGLAALKELQTLDLSFTNLTTAGAAALKRALPNITIEQ